MIRIGHGYDLHKLVEGRVLTIGGTQIPYHKGLLGHSDADVLVHAIIDALLGASSRQNIGYHFPDTSEKFKNADSMRLLAETMKILEGVKVVNIDSTIVAQEPKLAPYLDLMRENISKALSIKPSQVSIKPKTNEGMDSTGRGDAIAAHCVVLIDVPTE